MNNIIDEVNKTVDSKMVSEYTGVRHKEVLRYIDDTIELIEAENVDIIRDNISGSYNTGLFKASFEYIYAKNNQVDKVIMNETAVVALMARIPNKKSIQWIQDYSIAFQEIKQALSYENIIFDKVTKSLKNRSLRHVGSILRKNGLNITGKSIYEFCSDNGLIEDNPGFRRRYKASKEALGKGLFMQNDKSPKITDDGIKYIIEEIS